MGTFEGVFGSLFLCTECGLSWACPFLPFSPGAIGKHPGIWLGQYFCSSFHLGVNRLAVWASPKFCLICILRIEESGSF